MRVRSIDERVAGHPSRVDRHPRASRRYNFALPKVPAKGPWFLFTVTLNAVTWENRMSRNIAVALASMALVMATAAHAQIRTERVQFAKGASSKTITGSIKGDASVDYVVGARAGQTMSVSLKPGNPSNYFNVLPPGSDTALFVGSSSGNTYSGRLPANGDYRVRVYLMRNAARRNEAANYTLTIGVTGTAASATPAAPAAPAGSAVVTPGNMPAYCRGEVSGQYGTRPAYVKTEPATRGKDGSTSIAGTVDKGNEGVKRFACRFDAKGRFIDVMALTSDGE